MPTGTRTVRRKSLLADCSDAHPQPSAPARDSDQESAPGTSLSATFGSVGSPLQMLRHDLDAVLVEDVEDVAMQLGQQPVHHLDVGDNRRSVHRSPQKLAEFLFDTKGRAPLPVRANH